MTENLDVFLLDFAIDCVKPDASTIKVIFSEPDKEALSGVVITLETTITGKTSDLSDIAEGAILIINGKNYKARKFFRIDDGLMTDVHISEQ